MLSADILPGAAEAHIIRVYNRTGLIAIASVQRGFSQ